MVALVVFSKVPILGKNKTRIAKESSNEQALEIYKELLLVTAKTLVNQQYHVAYTGDTTPNSLQEYFPNAQSFFKQTGTTLGKIQKNAFLHLFSIGYTKVVGIGCDCPTRTETDLKEAIAALNNGSSVVVGKAEDGGYHLVGATPHSLCIFDAKQWSTPHLFAETMEIISSHNLTVHLTKTRSDIDTLEDYKKWNKNKN